MGHIQVIIITASGMMTWTRSAGMMQRLKLEGPLPTFLSYDLSQAAL